MEQKPGPAHSRLHGLALFARHQFVSILSTIVDYSVMIILVSWIGISPVPATSCGAACGGVTNFLLGRFWTFRATDQPAAKQALRYAVVSGMSLLLNTAGEHVFAKMIGLQYIVARVITSITVSVLWNYPLHRYVVFNAPKTCPKASPTPRIDSK